MPEVFFNYMLMRWTFILLMMMATGSAKAQQEWKKFALQDTNGRTLQLQLPKDKMLVLVFVSPECPLCKKYASRLRELSATFRQEAVFVGIIPGKTHTMKAIREYQQDYNIPFTLLKDESLAFTRSMKAEVTPEVMLVGPDGAILYRGLIDNSVAGLGKQRTVVTEHYLSDAIMQKNIVRRTKAIGCLINDY